MTPEEFQRKLSRMSEEARITIEDDMPLIAGKVAEDHFKDNFHKEGFVGDNLDNWTEVQRRQSDNVRGARSTRKILTGETADLGESIQHDKTAPGEVTIKSDLDYSEAHNEGTSNAGRNRNVTIPQRKFIGESEQLNKKIRDVIEIKVGHKLK